MSEALGEWFAHMSYRNLWVSKEIGEVMLKIINTSDFEKIKLWMTITKPYLYIDNKYKINRAEWILSFSCLSTVSGPQHVLPRFGTASINQITDEPYTYWRNRICDSWTFQYYFPVIKDGIKIDSSREYMKNHAKNVKNNNLLDLI